MCDKDRCCSVLNGRIKNLSWVYKTLVERADTDGVGVDDSAGTVKRDGNEVLSVLMTIGFEMLIGTAGIGDNGIILYPTITRTTFSNFASAVSLAIAVYGFGSHLKLPVMVEEL